MRLGRRTAEEVSQQRLAEIRILPLYRLLLHLSAVLRCPLTDQVKFHYTPCSRSDRDSERKQAAKKMVTNLPARYLEIWTEGSVGTLAQHKIMTDVWPIFVKWDEKWFSATSVPHKPQHDEYGCTATFKRQHNSEPSHLLFTKTSRYTPCNLNAKQTTNLLSTRTETGSSACGPTSTL